MISTTQTSRIVLSTAPSLSEEHIVYLGKRAVQPEVAKQAGLRSVSPEEVAQMTGCFSTNGGLAIPYEGIEPAYTRVRLDSQEGPRFLAPQGREVPAYLPPGMDLQRDGPLVVVEGPIKALALSAHGFLAVGLGGTSTTLTKGPDRRLNDSWKRVPFDGRVVVILFDSDRAINTNVARDEARLAMALQAAGAKVRIGELKP